MLRTVFNSATITPSKGDGTVQLYCLLLGLLLLSLGSAVAAPQGDTGVKRAIGTPPSGQALEVEITTYLGDEQRFRQGDELTFLLNLNKKAYITIIFQDAAGSLVQILPNRDIGNALYDPGWFFAIPDSRDPFMYRVAPPYGDEYVYVYASSKPLPLLAGSELNSGLRRLDGDAKGIADRLARFASREGAELSSARTHLITAP